MTAAEIIAAQLATYDPDTAPHGALAAAIVTELRGAGYLVDPAPDFDPVLLAALLAGAEYRTEGSGTRWASLREVYTYGDTMTRGHGLADALGWECASCRPDVGWPDDQSVTVYPDQSVRLRVECGHCGADTNYSLDGEELDHE